MNGSIDTYYVKTPATPTQRPSRDAPADRPYVRYRIRWYDPRDPIVNGKRKLRTEAGFPTLRDAEQALRQQLALIDEGVYLSLSKMTLGEWLAEYLDSVRPVGASSARGKLSPSTHENYDRYLRAWVVPYPIASVRLVDLKPHHFDAHYDELATRGKRSGEGLAGKSIYNVHNMLSAALTAAVRRELIPKNPLANLEHKPRGERPDLVWWSPEQLRAFVRHVRGDRFYAAWILFATTGMRRSEVAGISWRDVDLDAGLVTVRQALVPIENQPVLKAYPKSEASARKLALDPFTVDALAARRSEGLQDRLALGPAYQVAPTDHYGMPVRDLVFTWPDGTIINPKRWSHWFSKHASAAGLPRIRLHDVRHSYATAALTQSPDWAHVLAISKRLGHASVGVTLDTYSHVLPSVDQQLVNSMAELIMGETA